MRAQLDKALLNVIKAVIIVLICIPFFITIIRYSAWKMVLFLFFWILCPGAIVERYLLKQEHEDWEMHILSSFFSGMAITFVEWFLLSVLKLRWPIIIINPCIIIIFLLSLYFHKIKGILIIRRYRFDVSIHFLIVLLLAIYMCAYYLNFALPRAVDVSSVDWTWQIGNINQLSSKMPFNDIRVDGVTMKYHFFSMLFLAIPKYIFKGEGWIYLTQYSIWYLPVIITISFRKLYNRVTHSENLIAVAALATMTGFCMNNSYGTWHYHLFANNNGVGLGIPCFILLFLNLMKAEEYLDKRNGADLKLVIGFTFQQLMFLFVLAGIKGPFAILYVLALCVWTMLLFTKNKVWDVRMIIFVFANIVLFLIMFHFLLSAGTEGYLSDWSIDSVLQSAIRGKEIAGLYQKAGINGLMGRLIFLLPSLIASFTFLVPFGILVIGDLVKYFLGKKKLTAEMLFAYILVGGGLCAYYLFHILGNSEFYFLFAAIPFAGYICFQKAFEVIKKSRWRAAFSVIVLIIVAYEMDSNIAKQSEPLISIAEKYLLNSYSEVDVDRQLEFQAYDFLREYTPEDSLIATNNNGITFHNISAFAERHCYLEGYEYSRRNFGFHDGDKRQLEMQGLFGDEWGEEYKAKFCDDLNIDYLFYFQNIGALAEEPVKVSEYFELVYENEVISIFHVNR